MPIDSRSALARYLADDLAAHGLDRLTVRERMRRPQIGWQRLLRRTEYVANCMTGPVWRLVEALMRAAVIRRGARLGFTIPLNTCGPGLNLVHWGTIVISGEARIGAGLRIHPGTAIGWKGGAPQLGDRCYLGPGAKVIGPVVLGDGTSVGANAVVLDSAPPGSVLVGIPARNVAGTADQEDASAAGWPAAADQARQRTSHI